MFPALQFEVFTENQRGLETKMIWLSVWKPLKRNVTDGGEKGFYDWKVDFLFLFFFFFFFFKKNHFLHTSLTPKIALRSTKHGQV